MELEVQKCILQFIEPNIRIQLYIRCPSLHGAERSAPLSINHLGFENMKTTINGSTYQLGVHRDYIKGCIVRADDVKGGIAYDIDLFGFEDKTPIQNITPGDIDLRLEEWIESELVMDEAAMEIKLTNFLIEYNQISTKLQHFRQMVALDPEDPVKQQALLTMEQLEQFAEKECNDLRVKMQPVYARNSQELPPYTPYIQLTATGGIFQPSYQEFSSYSKQLWEASKHFHTLLFGNRGCSINVKFLTFSNPNFLLRFPNNTKLRVKHMRTGGMNFENFQRVIDRSGLPLSSLTFDTPVQRDDRFANQIIRTARKLTINNIQGTYSIWEQIIKRLRNPWLVVNVQNTEAPSLEIVETWQEYGKPFGTMLSFGVQEEQIAKDYMEAVRNKFKAEIKRDQGRSVTLVMNQTVGQLRVFYERVLPVPTYSNASKWYLSMKVEHL